MQDLTKYLLPMEERWKYTADFWVETYLANIAELAKIFGWDEINRVYRISGSNVGWPGVQEILRKVEAPLERDARAWGLFDVYVGHNVFPGVRDSFLEFSPEKVHLRLEGTCIIWEKAKELNIADKLDVEGYCSNSGRAATKAINPKLEFIPLHCMCKGDDYCDCHVVMQK